MRDLFTIGERLLTWLDVERFLKQETELWAKLPSYIHAIDCFADGMEIYYSGEETHVSAWLKEVFGHVVYQSEEKYIRLRIANTPYPISFTQEAADESTNRRKLPHYPLWRDMAYLPYKELEDLDANATSANAPIETPNGTAEYPKEWEDAPRLVSFHSFKGGVGRTTALMTYVAACFQHHGSQAKKKKILIVDADLEAPGVSFWLHTSNRPKVSFIQFLEAMHYPPQDEATSLDYFASELRKTSLDISGSLYELFILPAALDLAEIQDMPVQPEHLARNPKNPWILADYLWQLGKRLGVDAVFIDLRAGLSELASPILFDPRIEHFLVSTVAPQSVIGMAEVLKRLFAFNQRYALEKQNELKPSIILSLLTKNLRETKAYQEALEKFNMAYPSIQEGGDGIDFLEADFQESLMSIASVNEAINLLQKHGVFYKKAEGWAEELYLSQKDLFVGEKNVVTDRREKAKKLEEICKQAQFAEGGNASDFMLAIQPLRNIGKQFANELPSLLVIGAKGSGKTFTFRQVINAKKWSGFISKLGFSTEPHADSSIYPVLWSKSIEDQPKGEIKILQDQTLVELGIQQVKPFFTSELEKRFDQAKKQPPEYWEDFWDQLICSQFGIVEGGLPALNEYLLKQSSRITLVFDGVEDVFDDSKEENSRKAISALLRLPSRLSELENRCIGVVVFVRADYVQAAITQNHGQFIQRYLPFQLKWDPENFLRLAYWLCYRADVIPLPEGKSNKEWEEIIQNLQLEELKLRLETLWGRKLGKESSQEAYSARWVYTALSDLKGNVQARDLVRFLRVAAHRESGKPSEAWQDRLLSPDSIRKAIPECGKEKIEEASTEIAPIRQWVEILKNVDQEKKKIPFSATAVELDSELLQSLQEIGVIYEDIDGKFGEERFFLPEIYRYGLSFGNSIASRPRIQVLMRKSLGKIPL